MGRNEAVRAATNGSKTMPDDSRDDWLMEQLQQLARERGKVEAAELLEINYRTLNTTLETGQLSKRVREAAQRYFSESDDAEVEDGPGIDYEPRMVRHEEQMDAFLKELTSLRQAVVALQSRPVVEPEPRRPPERQRRRDTAPALEPPGVHSTVIPAEEQPGEEWPKDVWRLVEQWREAKVDRTTARHTLGWLRAERRLLELELQLAGDHQLTLPPADEPWSETRRRRELRYREAALHTAQVRVFWTTPLHWLMRAITLGLWGR